MHNDTIRPTSNLDNIVTKVQEIIGVDVTHTETAMILPNGDKMEYSVEE